MPRRLTTSPALWRLMKFLEKELITGILLLQTVAPTGRNRLTHCHSKIPKPRTRTYSHCEFLQCTHSYNCRQIIIEIFHCFVISPGRLICRSNCPVIGPVPFLQRQRFLLIVNQHVKSIGAIDSVFKLHINKRLLAPLAFSVIRINC